MQMRGSKDPMVQSQNGWISEKTFGSCDGGMAQRKVRPLREKVTVLYAIWG